MGVYNPPGIFNGNVVDPAYGGTGSSTAFTTGSVVFSSANGVYSQNNAQFFWDNTNTRLGIGTSSPSIKLDVVGGVQFSGALNDTSNAFTLKNTTAATSGAAQSSNKLFLQGRSYNSVSFDLPTNGYIQAVTITNNANPTVESIQIAPGSGSAAAATPYFKITSAGYCAIGNGNPSGILDVFNSSGARQFAVSNTTSAVNYLQATGAATGSGPQILVAGTDANIPVNIFAKGTGAFRVGTSTTAISFQVANVASQVNYIQASGAAAASAPSFTSTGSDASINLNLFSKNSASTINFGNSTALIAFSVQNAATQVNYLQATGSATTVPPALSSVGSDTNIDLRLSPKGAGSVQFGTYTASADAPTTGYITIKDSTGTARKLAIIT